PLHADRPRVPHERGTGMYADQQGGRFGKVVPAVHLHAEPVVDERVPEVLLALHGLLVGTAEVPFARALCHPATDAAVLFGATTVHLRACALGVLMSLLLNRRGPVIGSAHSVRVPAIPSRQHLGGIVW